MKEKIVELDRRLTAFFRKPLSERTRKICLLFFVLMCPVRISPNIDIDNWFILNHGRYILKHGFPTTEPFTIHTNMVFSMEKWLTNVINWELYSVFGIWAIVLMIYMIQIISKIVFFKLCKLVTNSNTVAVIVEYFVFFFLMPFFVARPQLFTILLVLIEMYVLERYEKDGNHRILILMPIISLLEMQLHSTIYPIIFICLAPYLGESLWEVIKDKDNGEARKKFKVYVVTFVTSFITTFINPYGYKSVIYIFKSYKHKYFDLISELTPPTFKDLFFLLVFIVFMLAFCLRNRERKMPIRYYLLYFGLYMFALTACRNVMFLLVGAGFILAYEISDTPWINKIYEFSLWRYIVITFVLITVGWNIMFFTNPFKVDLPKRDKEVIEWVNKNVKKGATMYTNLNEGAMYEFYGYRPYIDSRVEVFFKSINEDYDYYNEYIEVQIKEIDGNEFIEKYKFKYIIVTKYDEVYMYVKNNDNYKMIKKGKHMVYERK